jgi:hypothetical protein
LNGSKLTSDPAAIDLIRFQDGFVWQKWRFRNGLHLWQVWFGRILKEQLPKNQTASLPSLSGLSDSSLSRFQNFNSGLIGV